MRDVGVGDVLAARGGIHHRRRHPPEAARLLDGEALQLDELPAVGLIGQDRLVLQPGTEHRRFPVALRCRQERPLDVAGLFGGQLGVSRYHGARMATVTEELGAEVTGRNCATDGGAGPLNRRVSERRTGCDEPSGHVPQVAPRPELAVLAVQVHRRHTTLDAAVQDQLRVHELERLRVLAGVLARDLGKRVAVGQHRLHELVQPHVLVHQYRRPADQHRRRLHRNTPVTLRTHNVDRCGRDGGRQRVDARR